MEYSLVGLSPHASSPATLNIFDRQLPDATLDYLASTDDLTLDSLGFLANCVLIVCIIICCCVIYSLVTGQDINIEVNSAVENMQKLLKEAPQKGSGVETGTELIVIR